MSRKKREQKKTKRVPAKKRDVRIKTQEDRLLWKLVGVAFIAFAGFLLAALASYDPPPVVREGWQCGNLVGVVGPHRGAGPREVLVEG